MTAFEMVARAHQPALNRSVLLGGALAVLFSANAFLVLAYGALSVTGNSAFTGGILIASELTIIFLAVRRIELVTADYLFGFLAVCIAASFAINGHTAGSRETALLLVSLAAYPACRCISHSNLNDIKASFSVLTAALVALGAVVTLHAIFDQWPVARGKPIVLGFDAASTYFAIALALCLLATITAPLTLKRSLVISAALFLPTAILAAATVRFSLMATVGALCLATLLSRGRQRIYTLVIVAATIASIAAGLASRMDMSKKMMILATEQTTASNVHKQNIDETRPAVVPPSCALAVNGNNSVAIRKAVLLDGLYLIPTAGPFGLGLDSFLRFTCVTGTQVHVSIVQAVVEFGWLGGIAALLFFGAAALPLVRPSTQNARFVLCSLAYCAAMTFAHGRVSRDLLLFGMMGLAVGYYESLRSKPTRTGIIKSA